jgi:hypothetical protein
MMDSIPIYVVALLKQVIGWLVVVISGLSRLGHTAFACLLIRYDAQLLTTEGP